ncbi:MAG: 50S ribosomal protein L11 methyltransferase [Acidimicrobiia bacterium]|nr:50S ribosomal protein L11 methyltransferase [Acidimicrobiia bacterium]
MYSQLMFGRMFTDRVRHDAHVAALRQVVRPGSVVADIGAGTGIYSLLACQLGARRVFAIESDPVIAIARDIAADNGFADRITFVEDLSTEITLDERADVVVADLRGTLPLHGRHLPAIADAVARHLAPGGVLIPRRDRLYAALVSAPALEKAVFDAWQHNPLGLDMASAARRSANTVYAYRCDSASLLGEPRCVMEIDYRSVDDFDLAHRWEAPVRAGTAHAIALWFDAELVEGVGYCSGPKDARSVATIYGMAALPLEEPLELRAGDIVEVDLRASLDADYVWAWSVTHRGRTPLRQSQLKGSALTPASLRRRRAGYVPGPNERLSVALVALEQLAAGASLGMAATELRRRFPDRFPTDTEALTAVARVAAAHA